MKDKIIQIIPAPKGLTVEIQAYWDTGEMRESGISDKYGTPVFEEIEEPAIDDYGNPIYDEYPALCLALIEDEKGYRSITPIFYDDLYGTSNFEMASNWRSFRGCCFKDKSNDLIRIDIQDNMGTLYIPPKTSHYLTQKDNGYYGVAVVIDGRQIEVGEYSCKRAAELADEKIKYNDDSYIEMPSREKMDDEVLEEQKRVENNRILGELEEVFSRGTARELLKAGYYSIEEVKSATDEELRKRKIQKSCRDSIHRRLAKLSEKENKDGST